MTLKSQKKKQNSVGGGSFSTAHIFKKEVGGIIPAVMYHRCYLDLLFSYEYNIFVSVSKQQMKLLKKVA